MKVQENESAKLTDYASHHKQKRPKFTNKPITFYHLKSLMKQQKTNNQSSQWDLFCTSISNICGRPVAPENQQQEKITLSADLRAQLQRDNEINLFSQQSNTKQKICTATPKSLTNYKTEKSFKQTKYGSRLLTQQSKNMNHLSYCEAVLSQHANSCSKREQEAIKNASADSKKLKKSYLNVQSKNGSMPKLQSLKQVNGFKRLGQKGSEGCYDEQ